MTLVELILLLSYVWYAKGRKSPATDISEGEGVELEIGPKLHSCADDVYGARENSVCKGDFLLEEYADSSSTPGWKEDGNTDSELATTDKKLNFLLTFVDGISSGLSTVYRSASSAKDRLSSKISDLTSDFADKVRKILKEEFWDLIANGLSDVFHSATAPGTKLYTLGITAMNISLILLCLFLSYIFLYFFSLFNVMAFNCAVFLLHTFMGPLWIYEKFYVTCEYLYALMLWMVTHPYISSSLVILFCVGSFVRGIRRICYSESNSQQVNDIREEIMELNGKVDSLDTKIEEVLASLARIEVELS